MFRACIELLVHPSTCFCKKKHLPLQLTEFRATESSIDRCVFGIVSVAPMLVFVASGPAVSISGFRSARVAGTVAATG